MTEQTEETEEVIELTTEPDVTVTPVTEVTEDPETFPREYVQKLRDESAKYRTKAGKADDLARRLHVALVTATGRLADPEDLPFDEAHIEDEDDLLSALDDLLAKKPHLASRKPTGDVGQGVGSGSDDFSLAGMLRGRA
jgi:dsRNA-specific ribonuclease